MKLTINGLTIDGTHSEMVDFVELWQMRSLTLKAIEANEQNAQCGPSVVAGSIRGMKIETVPADTTYIPPTPPVVDRIKAARSVANPLPPVKHTDVIPADAPVTVIPPNTSGKKGRAAANGLASRIRFAIFNGKTTRAALMKAMGVEREVIHNSFYSLIETGHIEPVTPKAGRMSENEPYRLTERGLSFIEGDKKKLIEMGILKSA